MLGSPAELTRAFDELAIVRNPTFTQLVESGRLRYGATTAGTCDLIDDYSSRLVCECVTARSSLLLVWPDSEERRAPLALASGIVCTSVLRLGDLAGRGRVLYVGADARIREQFGSVRVGQTDLAGVFAQEFGRGDRQLQRVGPESSLPVITTIVSPAQPEGIIRSLRPRWIAVDCGSKAAPAWLPALLEAAKSAGVPIIGWTTLHLSPITSLWHATGACVFRWPRVAKGDARIESLDALNRRTGSIDLTPVLLDGAEVGKVSEQLVECYARLVRHVGARQSQLARGAISVAWRYLRLLESISVPPDFYDAECVNFWGMPTLSRLKSTLERFVQALTNEPVLRADLSVAYERLSAAERVLRESPHSPMWLAAANLAIDARPPSLLVFQSRSQRDMFRLALLGKFNVSEQDLAELGVGLAALSEVARRPVDAPDGHMTLIGLPSRSSEWRMDAVLASEAVRVVMWPHLEDTLRRRAVDWSTNLGGGCTGASPLQLAQAPSERHDGLRVHPAEALRLEAMHSTGVHAAASGVALWKRPEAAAAIHALFAAPVDVEDAEDTAPISQPDGTNAVDATGEDDWLEQALRVTFEDGAQILLPLDDHVNVIGRTPDGVRIAPRYCRALRVGDELLLVHGQHRRSVYDLLVSRVHSHARIAPWLDLVDRWHQELRQAFINAKRRSGATLESVLLALRNQGSTITTTGSVRGWVLGFTLAPSDWRDIQRLGEVLTVPIAKQFPREIGNAASHLAGLHRSLSNRLNRWLESEDAGSAMLSGAQAIVDADLGLTIDDFKHSLVKGRIASVSQMHGPFLRSHIGQLTRVTS